MQWDSGPFLVTRMYWDFFSFTDNTNDCTLDNILLCEPDEVTLTWSLLDTRFCCVGRKSESDFFLSFSY